jgi:Domain of unknown function (DUF5063)
MDLDQLPDHIVYSKNVIEFVTVVAETCLFLEHACEFPKVDFVQKSVKILPLLYLKASMLDIPPLAYNDNVEKFVTEDDYLYVKEQLEILLGADDTYLEVFHPDMALSDTPIAAFVSEGLADVYQELKDFAANYQMGDVDSMNDSLVVCLEAFVEHWGQKLLNALRALHALCYSHGFGMEDDERAEIPASPKKGKAAFLDFQQSDDDDLDNLLY